MSKMVAVRLDTRLLAAVDRQRRRDRVTRAKVIHDALAAWIARRQADEAMARDREGYARHPIGADEFAPILGAQVWPK
jgi:metal-responsive CopG/Arc/MetJ family transcriptional regulator